MAQGQIPAEILAAGDYEEVARRVLPGPVHEYVAGGSGRDVTLAANLAAFAELEVCPRVLRDVTGGHTAFDLNGRRFTHPILLAPVAFQKLVHAGGEIETAQAAHATDTCMVTSTLSSHSLEDIATATGAERWFQLYLQPDRAVTLDLVHRAQAAGYRAIVITLDASIQVPSRRAMLAGFRMPADLVAENLRRYPVVEAAVPPAGGSRIFQHMMSSAPTWTALEWLLPQIRLPVWIKGVLHPEDALQLKQRGVAGLIVSNHGGRGLDGVPASLRALPDIRVAVGEDFPLLLDGGVRSGLDVFKALARGADAVLVGRLQAHALAVAGALGVAHMLKLLREELEVCMAMAGCATLADIRRATVLRSC